METDWEAKKLRARLILERMHAKETPLPDVRPSDVLSEREWTVITMRVRDRRTLGEVGTVLGVTRERVRQIEFKAARKLDDAGLV